MAIVCHINGPKVFVGIRQTPREERLQNACSADHANHQLTATTVQDSRGHTLAELIKMSTRILLNPLLKPEILYWEISSRFEIPTWRLSKFRAAATTPPIHAMTFMVPGLPFHLQPLGPSHRQTEYITVSDVLDGIYERLNTFRLQDEEYDTLFGWQKQMARESCCTREEVAVDLQDEEFFRESIRGIDLMRGRLYFGGMLHQRDENGANIWIVVVQEEKGAPSPPDLPRLLNPGGITWDFKDPPPVFDDSEPFGVAGEPMVIVDINSHPLISIKPPSTVGSKRPFTPRVVLEAIYASLNVRVRDNTWPFWDSDATRIAKDVLQNASTAQRDNIITYLDMLPAERQRFLGLWHDAYSHGRVYTLLTQPSALPVPQIHHAVRRGRFRWDILSNPTDTISTAYMNEPATSPGQSTMGISIEVMPGEFWNVPISKAPGASPVTVRQLLSDIYKVLIEDKITISVKKLPLHLYHRIEQRASLRMRKMAKPTTGAVKPVVFPARKLERPSTKSKFSEILSKEEMQRRWRNRQKIPPAFKRIDILGATTCVGIEHRISDIGENDWKVYFSN